MAKAVAQDCEGPHECPTVWMKLSGSNVYFGEKGSLEKSVRKAQGEPSKDSLMEEAQAQAHMQATKG